jgi:hypothetical protein
VVLLAVAPAVAAAQDYKGATAYWAALTLSINGGQLTALSTQSAQVPCAGQSNDVDPIPIKLSGSVPITGGSFTAQGVSETDENNPANWTLTGNDGNWIPL